MLVKECGKRSYNSSINFIDSNDVFAGYGMSQGCCENFGWKVLDPKNLIVLNSESSDLEHCNKVLAGYDFTKEFNETYAGDYEEGGFIEFPMVDKEGNKLTLSFYNYHNGYYSHGFEFKNGEEVIVEGCL